MRPASSWLLLLLALTLGTAEGGERKQPLVVYALNAGGEEFTDSGGIRYLRDPLNGLVGTASDYGKQLLIGRVSPMDQVLYQTERYHHSTFGYDIPIPGDGSYVLILKFCEVYFNEPNRKVFDVVLNGEHTIVADLDIFDKVGRGVAHDEYVPFVVEDGKLFVNDEESDFSEKEVRVEFVKGYKDNPKVNAVMLVQGTIDDIVQLPPIGSDEEPSSGEEDEEEMDESLVKAKRSKFASGPKQPDPYSLEGSSIMLPVFIAIGAFIPLVFCFCKI